MIALPSIVLVAVFSFTFITLTAFTTMLLYAQYFVTINQVLFHVCRPANSTLRHDTTFFQSASKVHKHSTYVKDVN